MADENDFTLLPSRVRAVAELLRESNFRPGEFKWERVPSVFGGDGLVSRLVHSPTGYYFQFDRTPTTRPCRVRPGRDAWQEDVNLTTVDDQIEFFRQWGNILAEQLNAGDPVAEFLHEDDLFQGAEGPENPQFTKAQREEFTRRLEGIRELLLEQAGDNEDARERTNERIDYLIGALKRVGKRDWFFMACGLVLERGSELALTNGQIRAILTMLAHGVRQLTGG